MKLWLVGCFLMVASVGWGKTKMLMDDPENVVAGRYSLTREQKTDAARTAEALMNSMKEKDRAPWVQVAQPGTRNRSIRYGASRCGLHMRCVFGQNTF
jgi:hypothetical protein